MAQTKHNYIVRMQAEGGKVVSSELMRVGADGEKALTKIHSGSLRASQGMSLLMTAARRLIPVFGALGVGRALGQAVDEMGRLHDEARKLGIGVEALQEMRFAALQVGIATDTADMAMQRFVRRLGEAQQGGGELLPILEQYNIALRDSAGNARAPMDVLRDMADVIQDTTDHQERLRIAFKMFDSEGVDFVNVMSKGAEGLDRVAKQAHNVGQVFSEELVESAKRFDVAWDIGIRSVEMGLKGGLVTALDLAIDRARELIDALNGVRGAAPGGDIATPENLEAARSYLTGSQRSFQGSVVDPDPMLLFPKEIAQPVPRPPETPQSKVKEAQKLNAQRDRFLDTVSALEFQTEQLARTNEQQELYNYLKQAGVSLDSQQGEVIAQLVDHYQLFRDELNENTEAAELLQDRAQHIGQAFASSFSQAIAQGHSLREVLHGLFSDLSSMLIQETAGKAISSLVSTGFSAILGGFGGGGGIGAAALAAAGGPSLIGVKPFAQGGITHEPAIFGEAGPEAAVPLPDGRSIPVTLSGNTAGPSYTVNVDARGATDPEETRRQVQAAVHQALEARVPGIVEASATRARTAIEDKHRRRTGYLR